MKRGGPSVDRWVRRSVCWVLYVLELPVGLGIGVVDRGGLAIVTCGEEKPSDQQLNSQIYLFQKIYYVGTHTPSKLRLKLGVPRKYTVACASPVPLFSAKPVAGTVAALWLSHYQFTHQPQKLCTERLTQPPTSINDHHSQFTMELVHKQESEDYSIKPEANTPSVDTSQWP